MAVNDLPGAKVDDSPTEGKRLVSAWVRESQVKRLDRWARKRKASRSEVIAEAVEQYLDREAA